MAPGLAITAAHVAQDWIDHQEDRDGYKDVDSRFAAMAVQFFEGKALQWVVEAMYVSPRTDIAFLQFGLPGWYGDSERKAHPRCARLNLSPPSIGDEVRLFGFPGSEVQDNRLIVTPAESMARVTEVDLKRNIQMRPASYAHLEGEIEGGMSGGRCFDKDWNVTAVCSSGWSFGDISYAALLWPAMHIEIDLFKTGKFPVFELFRFGPARAVGWDRIQVISKGVVRLTKPRL